MARQMEAGSTYTDRLLKLVPAEFVTVYVAASQAVQSDAALRQPTLLAMLVLFVVLIPLYLYKFQGVTSHIQVAMTVLSFVIWAYTLGDAFEPGNVFEANLHYPTIASVMLLAWTGVVPLFVKPA